MGMRHGAHGLAPTEGALAIGKAQRGLREGGREAVAAAAADVGGVGGNVVVRGAIERETHMLFVELSQIVIVIDLMMLMVMIVAAIVSLLIVHLFFWN